MPTRCSSSKAGGFRAEGVSNGLPNIGTIIMQCLRCDFPRPVDSVSTGIHIGHVRYRKLVLRSVHHSRDPFFNLSRHPVIAIVSPPWPEWRGVKNSVQHGREEGFACIVLADEQREVGDVKPGPPEGTKIGQFYRNAHATSLVPYDHSALGHRSVSRGGGYYAACAVAGAYQAATSQTDHG